MAMNLWHDVPLGDDAPNEFNVIIEIPKFSPNKYEIDKETGLIALDRVNYGAAPYPFDYGFAPQTLWDDNDALDVIVFSTFPLSTGILVKVRPVGIMEMIDGGESDHKVLAVPVDDRRWEQVQDLGDLNSHLLREYANFFETYKALKSDEPGKHTVEIGGYKGKDAAVEAVTRSIKLYQDKYGA
jgi:inorganic pyrophosphatase